jgi:hypothetical protein
MPPATANRPVSIEQGGIHSWRLSNREGKTDGFFAPFGWEQSCLLAQASLRTFSDDAAT